jgi:hypothetical protein
VPDSDKNVGNVFEQRLRWPPGVSLMDETNNRFLFSEQVR